jgi:hypothetical protein
MSVPLFISVGNSHLLPTTAQWFAMCQTTHRVGLPIGFPSTAGFDLGWRDLSYKEKYFHF